MEVPRDARVAVPRDGVGVARAGIRPPTEAERRPVSSSAACEPNAKLKCGQQDKERKKRKRKIVDLRLYGVSCPFMRFIKLKVFHMKCYTVGSQFQ